MRETQPAEDRLHVACHVGILPHRGVGKPPPDNRNLPSSGYRRREIVRPLPAIRHAMTCWIARSSDLGLLRSRVLAGLLLAHMRIHAFVSLPYTSAPQYRFFSGTSFPNGSSQAPYLRAAESVCVGGQKGEKEEREA